MPTNLLILPLLGGFLLVHLCHYFRFRSQNHEGYRLLFESAVAGVALVTAGRLATFFVSRFVWSAPFRNAWREFAPIDFSGTGAVAFLLGLVLPLLANLCLRRSKAQDMAVRRHGSNLLRLLHSATQQECPVRITLDNRKVYVGFVVAAPNLESTDVYVQILPLLSGYRDSADLRLIFTYSYAPVYATGADPSDFIVIIRTENIRMASLYDPNIPTSAFEMAHLVQPDEPERTQLSK